LMRLAQGVLCWQVGWQVLLQPFLIFPPCSCQQRHAIAPPPAEQPTESTA